jgi:hypothetical protein
VQQIGEQDHLAGQRRVVVVNGPVRRGVLEEADRALEQLHQRDLLASVSVRVGQRATAARGECVLHERRADKRGRGTRDLPDADLHLLGRDENSLLELPEQELLLDTLADARMQRGHAQSLRCGQPSEPVRQGLLAQAGDAVSVS